MVGKFLVSEGKKDAGYVLNLSKDTFIKPVFKKIEEKRRRKINLLLMYRKKEKNTI